MIREDSDNFGLGRTSIRVEYHRCLAFALTSSLEDPSTRHRTISLNIFTKQIADLKLFKLISSLHPILPNEKAKRENQSAHKMPAQLLHACPPIDQYPL
eukprot:587944-Pelagomonas_calceolata.AAC.1